jgi:hypothetical protein
MKLRITALLAVVLSCAGAWCQSATSGSTKPASASNSASARQASIATEVESMKDLPGAPVLVAADQRLLLANLRSSAPDGLAPGAEAMSPCPEHRASCGYDVCCLEGEQCCTGTKNTNYQRYCAKKCGD